MDRWSLNAVGERKAELIAVVSLLILGHDNNELLPQALPFVKRMNSEAGELWIGQTDILDAVISARWSD